MSTAIFIGLQLVCISVQAVICRYAWKIEKANALVFELEEKLAAIEDIQARTVLAVQKVRKGEK